MILDSLQNVDLYLGLHPLLARAFDFLNSPDVAALAEGRHEIDGDRLYAMVARSQGRGQAQSPLEAHRKYIDIQFTISGSELIGWQDAGRCKHTCQAYDAQKDIEFFDDRPRAWVAVEPGHFAIFFPSDAHAPLAGSGEVLKAVVKVALE